MVGAELLRPRHPLLPSTHLASNKNNKIGTLDHRRACTFLSECPCGQMFAMSYILTPENAELVKLWTTEQEQMRSEKRLAEKQLRAKEKAARETESPEGGVKAAPRGASGKAVAASRSPVIRCCG